MKVKKYIVDSLPQAVGQIKSELGNDAMILHTKKIKVGGFLGLFGKEKIEVIAAVDNNTTSMTNSTKKNIPLEDSNKINVPAQSNNNPYQKNLNTVNSNYTDEFHQSLSTEVGELKNIIVKMMLNQSNEKVPGYQKDIKDIYKRLIKQGVIEEIALKLIDEVIKVSGNDFEQVNILGIVEKHLIDKFEQSKKSKEIGSDIKIVNFVGPTGVGKTTTIAKLAAEKVLKEKKKVAFITADTYRIGAVDQLRIYAEILNAPVEVVFSPQDINKSLEKFRNYDLIFMDTAGRNYNNDMYISELNNILSRMDSSETYLVLSLTHKYEDLVVILEQFKKIKVDKILFTKFDETSTYGNIINVISEFPYQTSYITNGQNVPDDIEVFNEKKIARAILGVI